MFINDNYDHVDENLEYICENMLCFPIDDNEYKDLKSLYNSVITKSCDCTSSSCGDYTSCVHGGNYILLHNELVLNKSRRSQDLFYECSQYCSCTSECHNRLVQHGPRNNLKVVTVDELRPGLDSDFSKQNALMTTASIPEGGFICEYAGELLTKSEALRRCLENDYAQQNNYVLCVNEMPVNGAGLECLQTFVDPSKCGNIGRYLNHSCDPNCEIVSVRVDCPIPKMSIFAKRCIAAGEELCFDYSGGGPNAGGDHGKICLCGAELCHKYIPNVRFV